jgi:hypothetical protein
MMTRQHNGPGAAPSRAQAPDAKGVAPPETGRIVMGSAAAPTTTPSPWTAGSHMVVPRVGFELPRQLSFDKWLDLGRQLTVLSSSSAWCLGDWLAYGQQAYSGRYRDAVEQTGLDYQTLRNYAWVARRFELSRRRAALTFGHHAEVASLPAPEQDFWLRKAEQLAWSTSQLRREVRASLQERQNGPTAVEQADPGQAGSARDPGQLVTIRIRPAPEQAQRWAQAASKQGLTVPSWAADILDDAARGSAGA